MTWKEVKYESARCKILLAKPNHLAQNAAAWPAHFGHAKPAGISPRPKSRSRDQI
jgi:hypothetical protein